MRILISFLLLMAITLSCEDDFSAKDFSGIIATDIYGTAMGELGEDDGDWGLDDSFPGKVSNLFDMQFDTVNTDLVSGSFTPQTEDYDLYQYVHGYPNPVSTDFYLRTSISEDKNGIFKIVIVNPDYSVKLRFAKAFSGPGSMSVKCNLPLSEVKKDEIHRVYYMTIDSEGNELVRGHGDFIYTDDPQKYFD